MPLCKFPEEASYSGSGDVNLAANWSCNPNDQRMLEVGRDGVTAARILQRRWNSSTKRLASTASNRPLWGEAVRKPECRVRFRNIRTEADRLIEALLPIRLELALKVAAQCRSTEFSHSLHPVRTSGVGTIRLVFDR
jgi:hypothetical protein